MGIVPIYIWLFYLNYLFDIFVILDDPGHFFGHLVPKARSLITLPTVIFFLLSCIVRELIMRAFF